MSCTSPFQKLKTVLMAHSTRIPDSVLEKASRLMAYEYLQDLVDANLNKDYVNQLDWYILALADDEDELPQVLFSLCMDIIVEEIPPQDRPRLMATLIENFDGHGGKDLLFGWLNFNAPKYQDAWEALEYMGTEAAREMQRKMLYFPQLWPSFEDFKPRYLHLAEGGWIEPEQAVPILERLVQNTITCYSHSQPVEVVTGLFDQWESLGLETKAKYEMLSRICLDPDNFALSLILYDELVRAFASRLSTPEALPHIQRYLEQNPRAEVPKKVIQAFLAHLKDDPSETATEMLAALHRHKLAVLHSDDNPNGLYLYVDFYPLELELMQRGDPTALEHFKQTALPFAHSDYVPNSNKASFIEEAVACPAVDPALRDELTALGLL